MGDTRRLEVKAPSLRVRDLTCDRRMAFDGLRAASAVDVREMSARRKVFAERCMTSVFIALCALMRLCAYCRLVMLALWLRVNRK